jgi:hypothetical protein
MSSAFHAPTNGQTENIKHVLKTYLRHFIAPTMTDWDEWLSRVQFVYNNSYHESVRSTPFRPVLDRDPRTPLGFLSTGQRSTQAAAFVEKLRFHTDRARTLLYAAQQRQKAIADRKRIDMDHAVADQVLLSTKNIMLKHAERSRKLMPRRVGPYNVLQKVGNLAYRLKMNPGSRIHPVFHVSLLEPYGKTEMGVSNPHLFQLN